MTLNSQIIPQDDAQWLQYFDPQAALAAVAAHVRALPSSQTAEQHTRKVYEAGLQYFINWVGKSLPTENLLTWYVGHLVHKGLKSTTIGSKYLAPLRLFLNKLAAQRIQVYGSERDFVQDCKEHIRLAAQIKTPRQQETSNLSPLWRYGKRLTLQQVNATLRQIDTDTIIGARDYALLLVAFESALRLSELHRLTLNSLSQDGDIWLITVRGKRSNVDPVPVSAAVVDAINNYVKLYNAPLSHDDPRRIRGNNPPPDASGGLRGVASALWQPLIHGDNHAKIGVNNYDPSRGISQQGIRNIIGRRTEAATSVKLSPHDTRRTTAAIAFQNGMPINAIQALLRHKDASVTLHYIGEEPDREKSRLTSYVDVG